MLKKSKDQIIIDLETFRNKSWCNYCDLPLSLKNELKERQWGLASIFTIVYSNCKREKNVHTDVINYTDGTHRINNVLAFGKY